MQFNPYLYLVFAKNGYIKHYYAIANRVADCQGGDGMNFDQAEIDEYTNHMDLETVQEVVQKIFDQSHDQVNGRVIENKDIGCIQEIGCKI